MVEGGSLWGSRVRREVEEIAVVRVNMLTYPGENMTLRGAVIQTSMEPRNQRSEPRGNLGDLARNSPSAESDMIG